ncbi:GGDEF domain-containing protein [Eubacterium sp.]|uniref:GGDEF domain-containing protein n=1 Tax=Eubacterium sp. TaxID=142586 RepID=UPI00258B5494|nr:GGDEF domain-containing protein [Eubacterium sp.]MCR5367757.1 GGDEF domain-containing protein [Eubacterium sp.]
MKKRIAVFTNGWNDEYLDFVLQGIYNCASEHNIDVFVFLEYTSYDKNQDIISGELNILNLPQLNYFDGVLLLGNTLNTAGENEILRKKILETGIPAVSLEYEMDGIDSIRTENINGMKELVEHMITVHGVKDIYWVGGPADNTENQERYKTVVDTMAEHGITVDPEKVIDGRWSYAIVQDLMKDFLKSKKPLPDAFICANDVMAMGVCLALEREGLRVPEDVKVTGFDNLVSGSFFSPIIASVDRGWNEHSYQCAEYLFGLMEGKERKGDKVYNSKFDPGESCGCPMTEVDKKLQREACRRTYSIPIERTIYDWHLIAIDEAVANVETVDDIHEALVRLFEVDHQYEGDEFCICMDQSFINSMDGNAPLRRVGYSKTMDIIYGMKDGKSMPRDTINTTDMVPYYDPNSDKAMIYLLVPLHNNGDNIGYLVIKNNYKIIRDFYLNSMVRHISAAMEKARQNVKLENLNRVLAEISMRDELTDLYNRMGYEKIAIPYLESLRHKNSRSVIMVADINRMKVINDKYGHLQGDLSIKIVAKAIKSVFQGEWKAVRYGGDEFVIIGEYGVDDNIEALKEDLIEAVRSQAEEMMLPFKLSISVGYVEVSPDNNTSIEEYFRMADEAMYEMKKEAHKNDGQS